MMICLHKSHGFTLVEVIMVIIILGIMASIAMKSLDSGLEATRSEETKSELRQLSAAISGNPELYSNGIRTDFGFVGDIGGMPPNLDALVSNPGYGTWNGPYIHSDFSSYSDDFKKDAWGHDYIYTGSTTIRSVGSRTDTIDYVLTSSVNNFLRNTVSGKITDAVGNPPGANAANLRVSLRYPNGSGGYADSILTPNSSGNFTFNGYVPIGNHTIQAIYTTTNDTVTSFVSVLPKSDVKTSIRFPGALWAAEDGSGSGTSSSLVYVDGSSQALGSGQASIQFRISNSSDQAIVVTWIKLTYGTEAYYEEVRWGGTSVFSNSSPRAGSDEQVGFSIPQNVSANESSITIRVNDFTSVQNGSGSRVNMQNKDMTVEFSDGSSISFNTGS